MQNVAGPPTKFGIAPSEDMPENQHLDNTVPHGLVVNHATHDDENIMPPAAAVPENGSFQGLLGPISRDRVEVRLRQTTCNSRSREGADDQHAVNRRDIQHNTNMMTEQGDVPVAAEVGRRTPILYVGAMLVLLIGLGLGFLFHTQNVHISDLQEEMKLLRQLQTEVNNALEEMNNMVKIGTNTEGETMESVAQHGRSPDGVQDNRTAMDQGSSSSGTQNEGIRSRGAAADVNSGSYSTLRNIITFLVQSSISALVCIGVLYMYGNTFRHDVFSKHEAINERLDNTRTELDSVREKHVSLAAKVDNLSEEVMLQTRRLNFSEHLLFCLGKDDDAFEHMLSAISVEISKIKSDCRINTSPSTSRANMAQVMSIMKGVQTAGGQEDSKIARDIWEAVQSLTRAECVQQCFLCHNGIERAMHDLDIYPYLRNVILWVIYQISPHEDLLDKIYLDQLLRLMPNTNQSISFESCRILDNLTRSYDDHRWRLVSPTKERLFYSMSSAINRWDVKRGVGIKFTSFRVQNGILCEPTSQTVHRHFAAWQICNAVTTEPTACVPIVDRDIGRDVLQSLIVNGCLNNAIVELLRNILIVCVQQIK